MGSLECNNRLDPNLAGSDNIDKIFLQQKKIWQGQKKGKGKRLGERYHGWTKWQSKRKSSILFLTDRRHFNL